MLLRVLPSVYPKKPETIHRYLGDLTAVMPQLEPPEQQHLIRLIQMVAEQHPIVSVSTVRESNPGVPKLFLMRAT